MARWKISIFTGSSDQALEDKANKWLAENEPEIQDKPEFQLAKSGAATSVLIAYKVTPEVSDK